MKDSVVIKSNKYGLTLVLDADIEFEQLIRDICTKFAQSRDFFGTADMVLSIEGRSVSSEEAAVIIEAIEINSHLSITLLEEKQQLKEVQMKEKIDRFYYEKTFENAKIIKGSVLKNQTVSCEQSVVILGDVKAKAVVEATGNVIVFGTVYGSIHAGAPKHRECFVAAQSFENATLQIGDVSGEAKLHKKWYQRMKKKDNEPLAVVVWEGELLMEPLCSGIIKQI